MLTYAYRPTLILDGVGDIPKIDAAQKRERAKVAAAKEAEEAAAEHAAKA